MLTSAQQTWIDHLSDTDTVLIVPFDATAEEKFLAIKQRIQTSLGAEIRVEHHGATSLGISGQDEIDVYVPVPVNSFNTFLTSLEELFGKPSSVYHLQRAHFITSNGHKHVDVFLINEDSSDWLNCIAFESYLRARPIELEAYRTLKEAGNNMTVKEYYRIKTEFINEILNKSRS